jgi:hypothetical protein
VEGSVVGVDVGVVTGASGAVGGSGVGSGMAKWTFFGGGVAVATTLRSGRSVGGGVGVGVGVSITLRGGSLGGGEDHKTMNEKGPYLANCLRSYDRPLPFDHAPSRDEKLSTPTSRELIAMRRASLIYS